MHTINGNLIVQLPEGAYNHTVLSGMLAFSIYESSAIQYKDLPLGSYTILCTLQEALDSEELAGKIGDKTDPVAYKSQLKYFCFCNDITNPSNWIVLKRP